MAQIYAVLYFCKILQFQKFQGADLKYGNNYFQSLPQKYPIKAFLVPNLRKSLQLDKFEGAVFKYDNTFLKFYQKNIQIRHIWSQIHALLFLFKVLQFDKSEGADSKYGNSFLKFYMKNIQTRHFCIFLVLYFCKTL